MQPTILHLAPLSLLLAAVAQAQSTHFDGLLNSPIGSSTLTTNPAGHLVVDNLGSSGKDGVRISLGGTQGAAVEPIMQLAPGESCSFMGGFDIPNQPSPAAFGVHITADDQGTLHMPDFSSLGQQTYGLRLYLQNELLFDQSGLDQPTRMQNNPWGNIPEKVYVFAADWVGGPNVPLSCAFPDTVVTPPGVGVGMHADRVEFYGQPTPLGDMQVYEILVDGPQQIELAGEELRMFGHFMQGLDLVHLQPQAGSLLIDNLGSSGCDGVSINPGGGSNQVSADLQELAAPDNTGGRVILESADERDRADRVLIEESAGSWLYTPDFSALGTQTYTLILELAGQVVFEQSGMSGPAASNGRFSLFYKKTTTSPDGTTTTEWCIGGSAASAHAVSGGPTIMADMLTMRAENPLVSERLTRLELRGADLRNGCVLNAFESSFEGGPIGTEYCAAVANSTGQPGRVDAYGSLVAADNDLTLVASQLPPNQFGYFVTSMNQASIPGAGGSVGVLCIGSGSGRFVQQTANSGAAGQIAIQVDLNNIPTNPSQVVMGGQTWNFQAWHRDFMGGPVSNFTAATAVAFE